MLVQLVADYGFGDLAYAEVRQRIAVHLPEAELVYTPVQPFDTLAAGFCIAQLALGEAPPGQIVYHNVAPREDKDHPRPGNEGEGLTAAWVGGVLVVGAHSGHALSFLREEIEELYHVDIPDSGSQFRSRDVFPALLPRLLDRDPALLTTVSPETVPGLPEGVVTYVDGYGNLKTTWSDPPVTSGEEVQVRIGGVRATATVGEATFGVSVGDLSFAPGSSGWRRRDGRDVRWWELLMRGGNAAEFFGRPATGAAVELLR
ncbi:MAG: hypothetical protein ACLGIF_00655 [Actinomycetes bacterium]